MKCDDSWIVDNGGTYGTYQCHSFLGISCFKLPPSRAFGMRWGNRQEIFFVDPALAASRIARIGANSNHSVATTDNRQYTSLTWMVE